MSNLQTDYQKAGFGGVLKFGARPALVVVDVCRAYVDPDCPLYAGASAAEALKKNILLRQEAHRKDIPVIFTRVEYHASGLDGGVFFRKVPALKHFVKGHPMAEFMPEFMPEQNDIVITKQYPSAFFGTSLAATLISMNVDTVLVTGYSTSGCVRATTLDAMQYGFVPFVVEDACADRALGPHDSNLFDLNSKYAEVVNTATAMEYLIGN